MEAEVEGFRKIAARTSRRGRMSSAQTGDHAIAEAGRGERFVVRLRTNNCCLTSTDSATVALTAGPGKPSEDRQHMHKKDGQIAHRTLWARREILRTSAN